MVAIKEKLFVADFLHCPGAAASLSHAGGGHAATCHVSPRCCDGHHGVLISIQLETERRQHWLQLHWEDETPVLNTFNQSWLGTVNGFKTSKDQSGHSLAQLSTVNRFHSSYHFNQLVLRKFLSPGVGHDGAAERWLCPALQHGPDWGWGSRMGETAACSLHVTPCSESSPAFLRWWPGQCPPAC